MRGDILHPDSDTTSRRSSGAPHRSQDETPGGLWDRHQRHATLSKVSLTCITILPAAAACTGGRRGSAGIRLWLGWHLLGYRWLPAGLRAWTHLRLRGGLASLAMRSEPLPGGTAIPSPGDPRDISRLGLVESARYLAAGDVTSRHLVEASLARASKVAETVNPFRVLLAAEALRAADAADERLVAGETAPLLGVPVVVKDDTDVEGQMTPFGCAGDFPVKSTDSFIVRLLRQAGAVIIAKSNTPELGLYPWTEGPAFGVTRNPWNLSHSAGGSSGGSAAAVASGVVAGALGSDGAGSVRIPASWCNLVGVKPQRGRLSTWPESEAWTGITSPGPLTRSVVDAAMLLDVLSVNHADDRHRPPAPSRSFVSWASDAPRALRVALALRPPWVSAPVNLDPQVEKAVRGVAERLAGLGHRVEEMNPRYGPMGIPFLVRAAVGGWEWLGNVPDWSQLDPRTLASARSGRRLAGWPLHASRRLEVPFAALVGRIFERFDVVITPVTATGPPKVGAADGMGHLRTQRFMAACCPYAWPWNYLGWPAISIPAGFVAGGLPVGAQLVGPANTDGLLISLAAQLEAAAPWEAVADPTSKAADAVGRPGPAVAFGRRG